MADRLTRQLCFLTEADRLKTITRSNVLMDGSRPENSAEHSWHLALWALVFAHSTPGVDITRILVMCLLHDLVEIDAGDHPIHLDHDADLVAAREQVAADRLFGLLPDDQRDRFRAIWEEFDAAQTTDAAYAKRIDYLQPIFQVLLATNAPAEHFDIVRDNLSTGRAAPLADSWPEMHALASRMLTAPVSPPPEMTFLAEADRLKSVLRATPILSDPRRENSAEHSWHLMLFALVLDEHATAPIDLGRVLQMLLLHDIVEIDAGDLPIHAGGDTGDMAAKEQAAADRLFALLPGGLGTAFQALWQEFEAAESPDAVFAKSLDRVQPVMANLADDGGSWRSYNVTRAQLQTRVGVKVLRGAPAVWDALTPRINAWFDAL